MATLQTYRSILFDERRRLARAEAIERHGSRAVRIAEVVEALAERKDKPCPLRSPKRVFVSYKWGTRKHNERVRKIVSELRARGNIVIFDEQVPRTEQDIATLVSRVVECHYFLMVIEPTYVEAVSGGEALQEKGKLRLWKIDLLSGRGVLDRGWLYDEFKVQGILVDFARIAQVGLLVDGDELPSNMKLNDPEKDGGNVFDVREPGSLRTVLDKFFSNRECPSRSKARSAKKLVYRSELAFANDDFESALSWSSKAIENAPSISDGYRSKTFAALASGLFDDAVKAAYEVVRLEPNISESGYMLALAIAELGRPDIAISIATNRRRLGVRSWRMSAVQAIALWCVDQPIAAINHIAYACSENPSLGSALRSCHNKWGKAGETQPPKRKPIPLIDSNAVRSCLAITVIQLNVTELERTSIAFEGNFPESRSMLARDRIIVSLSAHHIPVIDVSSLWFKGPSIGSAVCSVCPAKILIRTQNEMLCAECGIILEDVMDDCPACEHRSMCLLSSVLRGGSISCPYCRSGVIREIDHDA